MLLVLLFLVALAAGVNFNETNKPYSLPEMKAIFLSAIAYGTVDEDLMGSGTFREAAAVELHRLRDHLYYFKKNQQRRQTISNRQFRAAAKLLFFVRNSQVIYATRDCICLEIENFSSPRETRLEDKTLAFAFRGTAIKADYVVDVQLAVNKKHIPRLEEAKKFVAKILKMVKKHYRKDFPVRKMLFTGHR
jgi:hypothetical protein